MNKDEINIVNMTNDLKSFREYFKSLDFDFMVVGSLALQVQDIPIGRDPHDVDIEMVCNESYKDKFRLLSASCPKEENDEYKDSLQNYYKFKWGNTIFNVWLVKELKRSFVFKDSIKYAGVYSILKEKMKYKRNKDFEDLKFIIKKFIEL